jgi:hypothetical protein
VVRCAATTDAKRHYATNMHHCALANEINWFTSIVELEPSACLIFNESSEVLAVAALPH